MTNKDAITIKGIYMYLGILILFLGNTKVEVLNDIPVPKNITYMITINTQNIGLVGLSGGNIK